MMSHLFSPMQLFVVSIVLILLVNKSAATGKSQGVPRWRSEIAGAFIFIVCGIAFFTVASWPSAIKREELLLKHPELEVPEDWNGVIFNREKPIESPHGTVSEHPILYCSLSALWIYSGIESAMVMFALNKRSQNRNEN